MRKGMILLIMMRACSLMAGAEDDRVGSEFMQIAEDDSVARLQTALTRYEREDVMVDLLGAVHIGDRTYYEDLNQRFASYDVLLFEMVGGEQLGDGVLPEAPKDGEEGSQLGALGDTYAMMQGALKLSAQKDEIDYSKKNFVHADLTLEEFTKLQEEKGESLLGFALAAGLEADRAHPEHRMDMGLVMSALLSGNANGLKLELMKTLGRGDDQMAGFAGNSVIIGDRNAKCLAVLDEQIGQQKTKIGIFYGAAHYPDMEKRLWKRGFKKTKQEWLTAWEVPKPKPMPVKEPKPQKKKAA